MSQKELKLEEFEKVASSERGLFIIKFYSDTCMPCKTMDPVVDKLGEDNPNVPIYKVNTFSEPEISNHFGVRGVPMIVYCENREVIYQFTGVTPLNDLQFVIDNKDDGHFRQYGEFKREGEDKTDWFYPASIVFVLTALILSYIFL